MGSYSQQSSYLLLCIHSFLFLSPHPLNLPTSLSIDKVDTKEVQKQRPKDKVRKRPLMRNALKLCLVFRVRLDA